MKDLGHVVGNGEMKPDLENVAAIMNLPTPKDVHMVKSVLGAAGYYRDYVPNFAERTVRMYQLTRKNVPYDCCPDCQIAFDFLKSTVSSDPVLHLPHYELPFVLTTDWSKLPKGAVLSQLDPVTSFDHPIAFASRRLLNSAERNYSPTEGECLALI